MGVVGASIICNLAGLALGTIKGVDILCLLKRPSKGREVNLFVYHSWGIYLSAWVIVNEASLLGTFVQKRILLGTFIFMFKPRKVHQRGVERLRDSLFTFQDSLLICLLSTLRSVDVTLWENNVLSAVAHGGLPVLLVGGLLLLVRAPFFNIQIPVFARDKETGGMDWANILYPYSIFGSSNPFDWVIDLLLENCSSIDALLHQPPHTMASRGISIYFRGAIWALF